MPFANPVEAGNTLVRPAMHSPNYVSGVSGWSINKDGSAQFNSVAVNGGSVVVTTAGAGVFIYSGPPASGNLICSMASAAGADAFANTFPAGFGLSSGSIPGGLIQAGTITSSQLGAAAVTAASLAGGSVTSAALATAAVNAAALGTGAVTAPALAAGSVTANAIAANAIVAGAIAVGALDAMAIHAGTLTLDTASGDFLVYNGAAGTGNLYVSISPAAGIDAYGNSFPAGIGVFGNGQVTGANITMDTSVKGQVFCYSP